CRMTIPSVAVAFRKPLRSSAEPLGSRNANASRAIGLSGSASVEPNAAAISATGMIDRTLWNAHRLYGAVRQFERFTSDGRLSVESGIGIPGLIINACA